MTKLLFLKTDIHKIKESRLCLLYYDASLDLEILRKRVKKKAWQVSDFRQLCRVETECVKLVVHVKVVQSMDDYHSKQKRKEYGIQKLQAGDWKTVLDMFDDDSFHEPLLVWIRPSLDLLRFIERELKES